MRTTYFAVLVVAAVGTSRGDPFHELTMETIDVKTEPNPYFDAWSVETAATDTVTIRMPITADLPPDMMMRLEMKLGDFDVPNVEQTLCQAFSSQLIVKDAAGSGVPKGQFPKECPVKANSEYAVMNYKLPAEFVPPGIEGYYSLLMTLFVPGEKPAVTLTAEGKIGRKTPSVPKLG